MSPIAAQHPNGRTRTAVVGCSPIPQRRVASMSERTGVTYWEAVDRGTLLRIHLSPRAKRNEVVGVVNGALKVRVNAPPVDDKANDALSRFIAKKLGVPRSAVCVLSGRKSRSKTLLVSAQGLSPNSLIPGEDSAT